ncbi:MAG: HlyD family efflux transporter periplasmic adaptor subunit [Treponema sp.]|nr:HlyD family efflux transporter periplasmic adaptor subunit [Treponema sp.]
MSKKIPVVLIIVLLCAAAAAGIWLTAGSKEPVAARTVTAQPAAAPGVYTYNANITSDNMQNCISPMALELKKVYVDVGSTVKKGDLLYLLDDSDVAAAMSQAQAGIQLAQVNLERAELAADTTAQIASKSAFDAAEAAYNEAKANLDRISALQPLGGISQSDYEKARIAVVNAEGQYNQAKNNIDTMGQQSSQNVRAAQAQLTQARANYDAVQVNESKRRVTARFDGMVADIWAHENNDIGAGQKIMDIVDYDSLILEITVDQFEINRFRISEKIPVYINALDMTVNGTVTKISNQAIRTGEVSSFAVTIGLDRNPALKIGLSAEVRKNVQDN